VSVCSRLLSVRWHVGFYLPALACTSFDGEVVAPEMLEDPEKAKTFDLMGFIGRHSKDLRFPEIQAAAKSLKTEHGFKKVGAIGFCYGGWAVFQLGAKVSPLPTNLCYLYLLFSSILTPCSMYSLDY
jgi:Dienelactone hydrolase family